MFSQMDFEHPLLAPFSDPRFNDFTKIRFWKHRKLSLEKLPDAQREAFVLIRLQELSYEEVATTCGTTVAAAKMRVARATAALAEILKDVLK